jgi:maleylpyruvate isomerase
MRAREMWIHAVDLDVGASLADAPGPMLVALLSDAADTIGASPQCPPLMLLAGDVNRSWAVGRGASGAEHEELTSATEHAGIEDVRRVEVCGSAAGLALWLLGRSKGRDLRTADGSPLPVPPRWL